MAAAAISPIGADTSLNASETSHLGLKVPIAATRRGRSSEKVVLNTGPIGWRN
jgi:hypothetical protein